MFVRLILFLESSKFTFGGPTLKFAFKNQFKKMEYATKSKRKGGHMISEYKDDNCA